MRIYHTETQADYDALMVELKSKGCTWGNREIPIKGIRWEIRRDVTCVHVSESKIMTVAKKSFFAYHSPEIPITKYKAKVNEKMKFTEENVYRLFTQYRKDSISFNDLQDEILKLDDTPEKVVVPRFVAEWIDWNKETGADLKIMLKSYRHYCDNINSYSDEVYGKKAVQWYVDNPYKFIQAYEDGYTIESGQLYYIPLPHLETAGGTKQYLTKSGAGNYFALSPCIGQKQRYTKEELKQVPEIYKPYAKLIEREEE